MRPEFEKYEEIDSYLNGKLSMQDSLAFEQQMKDDETLREEVFDRKITNEIILESRFNNIASSFGSIPVAAPKTFTKPLTWAAGAAGIAVIASIVYYYSPQKNTVNPVIVEDTIEQPLIKKQAIESDASENTEAIQVEKPEEKIIAKNTDAKKEETRVDKSTQKNDNSYVVAIPIHKGNTEKTHQNTYAFSPKKGENWTIPMLEHESAILKVFTSKGTEVFSASVKKEDAPQWDGRSIENKTLEAGTYLYMLDFGKGNTEQGHVIINP
jgi:hypothetical protein